VALFIYYLFIYLFIFFCHIFYLLKGGGWHGFYFSPFLLFFVLCVKDFVIVFLLLPGEGGVSLFFILNYYFIYF